MKVLIIGGTGNLSAPTVAALQARGDELTLLTSGRTPPPTGMRHWAVDRGDATACRDALKAFRGDAVVNFLGFTPADCQVDFDALRGRIGQYVFISSATVYEKPHRRLPLTEDTPLGNPFSPYAQGKIESETFLRDIHGPDFPVTVVRPSHTFGRQWIPSPLNGSDYTVAARIIAGKPIIIHDDGHSMWTLTAATDFAAGLAGLIGHVKAAGETFHITSDQVLTWNGIYFEIGLALGRAPHLVPIPSRFLAQQWPDARARLLGDKSEPGVFDNTKIKCFLPDFECRLSFRAAIRQSVAWLQEDAARRKVNLEQDQLIERLIKAWQSAKASYDPA